MRGSIFLDSSSRNEIIAEKFKKEKGRRFCAPPSAHYELICFSFGNFTIVKTFAFAHRAIFALSFGFPEDEPPIG